MTIDIGLAPLVPSPQPIEVAHDLGQRAGAGSSLHRRWRPTRPAA
jgi:hypothetical protein